MRIILSLLAVFASSAIADGPCDVESDDCRAVINASACFNEFISGGNKNSILNCLAGTEGDATPTAKVREYGRGNRNQAKQLIHSRCAHVLVALHR